MDNIQAQLAKTVLYAPIDGVISVQDIKIGETVSPNVPVVSMISDGFEIDANVSERDVSKIHVDDEADVTTDTSRDAPVFKATVTSVDPAETVINGVSTYKVTLHFVQSDERIKSGMTANIDIITKKLTNVVAVPEDAIITKGDDTIVLVDTGKSSPEERIIKTGIVGSNGFVQIIA